MKKREYWLVVDRDGYSVSQLVFGTRRLARMWWRAQTYTDKKWSKVIKVARVK